MTAPGNVKRPSPRVYARVAPFCLVAGYLLFKSGNFPKPLGVLYVLPAVSYPTSSFASGAS